MRNNDTQTANISYPGFGGLLKVCKFKKSCNGLIGWWLRNPGQLISATRCTAFNRIQNKN